jgi:hypothetical protein
MGDGIRATLSEMADMLERGSERYEQLAATWIRAALSGSPQALDDFIVSNELWGGAGSIADQAFASEQTLRPRFEDLMIKLGRLQVEADRANLRTESWVGAFESWRDADLRTGQSPPNKAFDDSHFLQRIAFGRSVRFLIGAMVLPGYLAVRIPYWRRDLSKHPLLALAMLGAYAVSVFFGLRCYAQKGRLDRSGLAT